jgi:hypothetical protein
MIRALSILALLHCLCSFQANGAEFVIGPDDIDPKFDDPQWTQVEFSAVVVGGDLAAAIYVTCAHGDCV